MLLPETLLKKILDGMLALVRADFKSKTNEQETFLYKIFNGNEIEDYNYYKQAKELVMRPKSHSRYLDTRIFFDRTRAHIPTIHITLPSEHPIGDGIGLDENYIEPTFNDTDGTFNTTLTRTFSTKYNIVFTSDNTFEVIILYYLTKALILACYDSFELQGLRNIKMSGQDLMANDDLMPQGVYMRGIALDLFYEFSVPHIQVQDLINSITFIGSIDEIIVTTETIDKVTFYFCNKNIYIG